MTNQLPQLTSRFAALADPTRAAMVARLGQGACAVSDLAAPFNMAMPTILQHLRVLEGAGLVTSKKTGRVRTVRLDGAALRTTGDWLLQQADIWEKRLDRLDMLALKLDKEDDDD